MPEAAPAAAPAPSNGAPAGTTQAPADTVQNDGLPKEVAAEAGKARGPDGKFASTKPAEPPKPKSAKERILEMVDDEGNVTLKLFGKATKMPFERALSQFEIDGAGRQRFTEAQKLKDQAEQRMRLLAERPDEALRQAGLDPEAWAESLIAAKVQRMQAQQQLTPEQQLDMVRQEAAEQIQAEREQLAQYFRDQAVQQQAQTQAPILEQHIPKALDEVGLSKSVRGLERLKTYLGDWIEDDQAITPEAILWAAQAAREEAQQDFQEMTKGMNPMQAFEFLGKDNLKAWGEQLAAEDFLSLFGEKVADTLRRYDLDQYEKSLASKNAPPPAQKQEPAPEPRRYLTEAEYMSGLKRKGLL